MDSIRTGRLKTKCQAFTLLEQNCLILLPDICKKCLQVCDGEMEKHSPSSKKGEVWPENYVGGEEMAVGRGTGINIISYLINIAFFAANLMEAK